MFLASDLLLYFNNKNQQTFENHYQSVLAHQLGPLENSAPDKVAFTFALFMF